MREILFRGKRVDNGKWVKGYYIKATHHWHEHGKHEDWLVEDTIQNGGWCNVRGKYAIIPETLCEFTGGYGRNTTNYAYTKLWENDIVKIFSDADGYFNGKKCYIYGVITYDEDSLDWKINLDHIRYGREEFLCNFTDNIEVVGNRFDNPELLTAERKGENEN
jgi:hypothetical protein